MRFPPRRIALPLLALLLSASARAHNSSAVTPVPSQTLPPQTSPSQKTTPKPTRKKVRHRRNIKTTDGVQKVVVRHGGTTEALPQMAPVVPGQQESSQRRKSGQLLTATEANLKSLGDKKLTPDQQATVNQIRQFMEQSRAALDAGDVTQGYNLASKANVLSGELKTR